MAYNTRIEIMESYIRIEVSGERPRGREAEPSLEIWKEVAGFCEEHPKHAILAVQNLSGRLPAGAAYQIGTSLDTVGIPRRTKIALVDLNIESLPDNLFSATVAQNRGYQGRVFSNEADAVQWLLEKTTG
ncbi:MAG: hypothetical protein JXA25_04445 [Anaerolineales bacterium]|nr:hypothetical protein [Anaerolineales bacterium]